VATFIKGTDCSGGCPGCTNDPCAPTPAAPAPTLLCDSISASATKCGHDEFGTPSSPPKKYLVKTQSGGLTDSVYLSGYTYTNTWSGAVTFSRSGCSSSDTRQLDVTVSGTCSASISLTGASGQIEAGAGPNGLQMWDVDCSGSTAVALYGCSGPTVVSTTVKEYASPPCGSAGAGGSTVTLTLSDEYTTAQLISDVVAALPSYPGTWVGTCSSFRDLESDELTYTIRRFKYKFQLPDLTGFTCYKITWNELFTPAVGSPYILNNRVYDWNGLASETGEWEIDEQAVNGSVTITDIAVSCECP
jgi:hypothetical protein